MNSWHIITGEYPPQIGGVSDYTRHVACGLAQAGDRVHVWAPAYPGPDPADSGVEIRRVTGTFGPRALLQLWREFPSSARILVQYVPHAFGWKAMNVPFCIWLWSKRNSPVWVMFHEVAMPVKRNQPLLHSFIGLVNRRMSWLVVRSADRIWVSIPAWEQMLRRISAKLPPVGCLPIPSSIPVVDDPDGIAAVRAKHIGPHSILLGHFGTYGASISAMLRTEIPAILNALSGTAALLMGRGSERFARELIQTYPGLESRVHATGAQDADSISRGLSACDVLIQPYPDGVSSRRTSITAALAHRRPVLTTAGPCTEELWQDSRAVVLTQAGDTAAAVTNLQHLLGDPERRVRMAAAAGTLYESRFALWHTIQALRAAA